MAKKVKITKGGQTVYPATVMDAVVHPDLRVDSSKLIEEVNVSKIYPTGGIDGTNKYTLETAIAKVPASLRNVGIKCSFLDDGGKLQTWEYLGGAWAAGSFSQVGAAKLSELESEMPKAAEINAGNATYKSFAYRNIPSELGGNFSEENLINNSYRNTAVVDISRMSLVSIENIFVDKPSDIGIVITDANENILLKKSYPNYASSEKIDLTTLSNPSVLFVVYMDGYPLTVKDAQTEEQLTYLREKLSVKEDSSNIIYTEINSKIIPSSLLVGGTITEDALESNGYRSVYRLDVRGIKKVKVNNASVTELSDISVIVSDSKNIILDIKRNSTINDFYAYELDLSTFEDVRYVWVVGNMTLVSNYPTFVNLLSISYKVDVLEGKISVLEENVGNLDDYTQVKFSSKIIPNEIEQTFNDSSLESNGYRQVYKDVVDKYRKILVSNTVPSFDTSNVAAVITDKEYKVLKTVRFEFSEESMYRYNPIPLFISLPEGSRYLYTVSQNDVAPIIVDVSNRQKGEVNITAEAEGCVKETGPMCHFTRSPSTRIKGSGNKTIKISLDEEMTNYAVASLGILIPYATQDKAEVKLYKQISEFDDIKGLITIIGKSSDDSRTDSGKAYNIRGDSFHRVNSVVREKVFEMEISADEGTEWEISITDRAVTDDFMECAPVVIIYDGGHWNGKVYYNKELISLWSLHRKLGIPYCIATFPTAWDDPEANEYPESEVLEDIKSGFAEKILRLVPDESYKGTDKELVEHISDSYYSISAANRATVLGQHVFDGKLLRGLLQSNAHFVRLYPLNNANGELCEKPGDDALLTLTPCSYWEYNAFKYPYPVIFWAHGIGIPQGDEAVNHNDYYADKEGVYTERFFKSLLRLQEEGLLTLTNASGFIAMCKKG